MKLVDSNGKDFILGTELARGGEAWIYEIPARPDLVAKIYFQPTPERIEKLRAMIAKPPQDPSGHQGPVSICWPKSLLFDSNGAALGFSMHRLASTETLPVLKLYNPRDRKQNAPAFTWAYLLRAAANIASVADAIHAYGYVIGDLNESNFLVSDRALVALVDCDSLQVPRPGGGVFRCLVGKPEFTAPELQGLAFNSVDRTQAHDHFALGVLIFLLLMEGVHPFFGVWKGKGDPPAQADLIKAGHSPYAGSSRISPMPAALPFAFLPDQIRCLASRCFGAGHRNPVARPSAQEWLDQLSEVEKNLRTCSVNKKHVYPAHQAQCPWCERTAVLGGNDPYPSASASPRRQRPMQPAPFVSGSKGPAAPAAPPPVPPVTPPPGFSFRAPPFSPQFPPPFSPRQPHWRGTSASLWSPDPVGPLRFVFVSLIVILSLLFVYRAFFRTRQFAEWKAATRAGVDLSGAVPCAVVANRAYFYDAAGKRQSTFLVSSDRVRAYPSARPVRAGFVFGVLQSGEMFPQKRGYLRKADLSCPAGAGGSQPRRMARASSAPASSSVASPSARSTQAEEKHSQPATAAGSVPASDERTESAAVAAADVEPTVQPAAVPSRPLQDSPGASSNQAASGVSGLPAPSYNGPHWGLITWDGELYGNRTLTIVGGQASLPGMVDGRLPEVPCIVEPVETKLKNARILNVRTLDSGNGCRTEVDVSGHGPTHVALKWHLPGY
jgi:serine/threonine protein kinase